MKIGGFQKFSLIDYPGKICAVIFTQGCNFRCPYCHNPELVLPEKFGEPYDIGNILAFLEKRRKQLDGVVISGGEPTIQENIVEFIQYIKTMGYYIKLDTNGSNPRIVKQLLNKKLLDYIAMDIKAPFEKYHIAAGIPVDTEKIKETINIIKNSNVEHTFRTTFVKNFLNKEDVNKISFFLNPAKYNVQEFVPRETMVNNNFFV